MLFSKEPTKVWLMVAERLTISAQERPVELTISATLDIDTGYTAEEMVENATLVRLRDTVDQQQAFITELHRHIDKLTIDGITKQSLRNLHNEVDCRIEHGANSNGHLEYVRDRLDEMEARSQ